MSKITVDFSNVEGFQPVDADTYPVCVKALDLKKPKDQTNSNPYFNVRVEITEGDFAGRQLFANMTTNPERNQNGRAKNSMLYSFFRACGVDVVEGQPIDIDTEDVLNTHLMASVDCKDSDNPDNVDPRTGEPMKENNIFKWSASR